MTHSKRTIKKAIKELKTRGIVIEPRGKNYVRHIFDTHQSISEDEIVSLSLSYSADHNQYKDVDKKKKSKHVVNNKRLDLF